VPGYAASTNSVPLGLGYGTVASVKNLPDGDYIVWGDATVVTNTSATVACELDVNGSMISDTTAAADTTTTAANVAITSAATLGGGTNTVSLECASTVGATHVQTANVTLLPIDALN
jgi:hypothetical protein